MISFVVVQYVWASRVHARFQNHPNYLLVKYEDLVAEHTRTLKQVCTFAGIEYTDDMLEQGADRAQRSSITGELRTRADVEAASKWKSVITRFEEFFVTLLCKRSMARFGFDPQSHPVYANVSGMRKPVTAALQKI